MPDVDVEDVVLFHRKQSSGLKIKSDRINLVASVVVLIFCCLLYVVLSSNTPSTINSDLQQRLNYSSRILRIHYNETIGKQNMKSVHSNHRSKKRFYVELSIKNNHESRTDTDKHLLNNYCPYHVTQQLDPKSKITIDQLIGTMKENNIVLIQGAGGIGKSYMLETAALHWAEGKIWQEMDFVFLLEFRMLNLYQKKNFSLEKSLEMLYPSVFTNLKYDELLREVGDRIIFLMDGLDEFANFNKTLTEANTLFPCNDSSISTGFYSLIQPKCFPGRKLVISGRTSHCEQLRNSFKYLSIDSFNIVGFSSIQVNEYIEHYFSSNNTKANRLKVVIKQSESLQLMSRVPAFLWSLCELHQETSSFGDIATMTPIFAWQLTIFLREHLRQLDENISIHHPMDIFENPRVKELVLHLSEVAEMTLRRDEALISSSELDSRINVAQLETSGLLSRVKTSFGEKIQFNHMQMQEFLTAIYYISNPKSDYQQLLTSDSLSGAVSFYAGLSGACLQNSNSSKDLQKFVTTLRICVREQDIFAFPDYVFIHNNKLFLETLLEFQNNFIPKIPMQQAFHFILKQKETRYSTTQLVYFFKNFGHQYNSYIGHLQFVETLTSEETKIIAPHICNISTLYMHNSYKYQLEMIRMITQEILNCPLGSLIDTLMIDYRLLNRTFDYITTNEMALERIHNVEHFIVRIFSNTNRGFKLLRNNILQHHHLPSYKLRHLEIYIITLTLQCCDYLTEILPFIEKITVKPITGYLYPNYVVNYCKNVIGERLRNKLPSKFMIVPLGNSFSKRLHNKLQSKFEIDPLEYSWFYASDGYINGIELNCSELYTDDAYLLFVIFLWGTVYTAICFILTRKRYFLICFLIMFYLLELFYYIPVSFFPEPIEFISVQSMQLYF